MANARGQKRDLERARQERQAKKRARRQGKPGDTDETTSEEPVAAPSDVEYSESDILAALADLHSQYASEAITLDEFESSRDELMQRLRIV